MQTGGGVSYHAKFEKVQIMQASEKPGVTHHASTYLIAI